MQHWFRNNYFYLGPHEPDPPFINWLRAVQGKMLACFRPFAWLNAAVRLLLSAGQVQLILGSNLGILDTLTSANLRIVTVRITVLGKCSQLPAQLAGLTQLAALQLGSSLIQGSWQHLLQQLQEFDLFNCRLRQLPAELAGLAQLSKITLDLDPVEGGWQHLPRQLKALNISSCSLQQAPQLVGLTQLTDLWLGNNPIQGGWQGLPRQLRQLYLGCCSLQQVPVELAGLTGLTRLWLSDNAIEGG